MKVDLKPRFDFIHIQYLETDTCWYSFTIYSDGSVGYEEECFPIAYGREASKKEVRLVIKILEYALRKVKERYGIGD